MTPQPEGSHGKLHPTTEILSHASRWRRAAWICVRSRYAEPRRWRAAFRSSRMASLLGPSASPAQPRFRMAKSPRPVPTWRSNCRASSAVFERASVRSLGDRFVPENESPQMPLTRLNDSAFDAQLEGVYFGMWNGRSPIRCFVTHEALTDKTQGSGQAESLDVFHEYRSEIENLASAKYDAGKIKGDGLVVVDSPDLNPEQFQQGLASDA